ncbi:histidine kinase [Skermanella stibiiresistens SB22]|uniref:histidine kinase n=1 Tax=Skermanella stibiiresistens SB22 TaxID=1385369 RepID=W9H1P4_9PROT|nr:sensor histidine kinase [Skermanella stibiiresistens]EWY38736.1 histidine kinase [Skermanella stibiiresistens SB22]
MIPAPLIAAASFAYLFLLFAIAWAADRKADKRAERRAEGGWSAVASPYVYALSLGVFCTTWTFYGSVGRAATQGIGFLPVYLGPTLVMVLAPLVIAKILRIARKQRSTSIADFIASRYGKSHLLGGLVAGIAVFGVTPYIALQLKAVSVSFDVLAGTDPSGFGAGPQVTFLADKAFHVALLMAAFAIVFGTRNIDATEHHRGMVAAIAFESVVKLVSFLAVGVMVVWGIHDGFGDLAERVAAAPAIARLLTAEPALADGGWITVTLLSMAAIICLPRQFQVMVVENMRESHLRRAMWLFPLYMLLINLFVLPVAVTGLLLFPDGKVDPDMFVLALPLSEGWRGLALLAFLGGLSAATSMIIVETVALSTMVSNDLVIPALLGLRVLKLERHPDLTRLILAIRRIAIVVILLLGYAYFRFAGSAYALGAIGLISFAAVAQFAPALLGGIFWSRATRLGAIAGLVAGIAAWTYTLLLPSFARSGWLDPSFLSEGPGGVTLLRPYALFGLEGLDPLSHALFWSMVANVGLFVGISLFTKPSVGERVQALAFVDVFRQNERSVETGTWRGDTTVGELIALVSRFLGPARAEQAFVGFARGRNMDLRRDRKATAELMRLGERLMAGAIGAASARVALASAVKGGEVTMAELLRMLDETSQVLEYSRQLEQKSAELERTSAALRAANEKLLEVDRLKDDFLSTVTHELRTPLTSVRAFAEILHDNPDIDPEQSREFLSVIIRESERLTRLINQVLDMAKIEAGEVDWTIGPVDLAAIMRNAAATTAQVFKDKDVALEVAIPAQVPIVQGDHDRLTQVAMNLLSNAAKFTPSGTGRVVVSVAPVAEGVKVAVTDNGPGIAAKDAEIVFDRFRQVGDTMTDKPQGTGLGLAICKSIVEHLGGRIWVDTAPGQGATFAFVIPYPKQMTV